MVKNFLRIFLISGRRVDVVANRVKRTVFRVESSCSSKIEVKD